MTPEIAATSEADRIRISIVKLAYEDGMRAGEIKPGSDLAPWLIGGLKALEEGQELTSELLQKLDADQTMVFPETAILPQTR